MLLDYNVHIVYIAYLYYVPCIESWFKCRLKIHVWAFYLKTKQRTFTQLGGGGLGLKFAN